MKKKWIYIKVILRIIVCVLIMLLNTQGKRITYNL